MFSGLEIFLVFLFLVFKTFVGGSSLQLLAYCPHILTGFVIGTIVGDTQMGLTMAATLTLMSLGVGGFGGSSVPDYNLGTILGTLFAVKAGSFEVGFTVAIPVAMLGTYLDVFNKTIGSFFAHKAMACNDKCDFHGAAMWTWLSEIPRMLVGIIPTILAMTVGADAISSFLDAVPAFIITGMSVAGGILPAMGFAILMRYMNVKKYGVYMILGFVCAAWMDLPMLAIAALAFIIAFEKFQTLVEKQKAASIATVGGGMEDE